MCLSTDDKINAVWALERHTNVYYSGQGVTKDGVSHSRMCSANFQLGYTAWFSLLIPWQSIHVTFISTHF